MENLNITPPLQKQQSGIYSNLMEFPFTDIIWNRPTHILGEPNNFIILTQMKQRGMPIYVETPECSLCCKKTGETETPPNPLIKIGKKYFLDFLFMDVEWLSWLEHLEELSHKRLLENQTEWFQTEMTEEDMENLFVSPFKMVKGKGGKQFSVRTTFPLDKTLKIFNEKRQQVDYELDDLGSIITEGTRFKAIVEVVGIKCSPRNFHLEMEVKQMMMIQENPVFMECLISPPIPVQIPVSSPAPISTTHLEKQQDIFIEPSVVETETISETPTQQSSPNNPVEEKETNPLSLEVVDFDFMNVNEKTEKERAIEKMKNIRVLGMTEFLKKRGIRGENKLLDILSL